MNPFWSNTWHYGNRYQNTFILSEGEIYTALLQLQSRGSNPESFGIHQNLNKQLVAYTKSEKERLGVQNEPWKYLTVIDGVLVENKRIDDHDRRQKDRHPCNEPPRGRTSFIVPLPKRATQLKDPIIFKRFRDLVYFTQRFFDMGRGRFQWLPDKNGIFARDPKSRSEVFELSQFHNRVMAAIKHLNRSEHHIGNALLQSAFQRLETIITSYSCHPRLFTEIFAVLHHLHSNGYEDFQKRMLSSIKEWVEMYYAPHDIRRIILLQMEDLTWDSHGHIYLAYDAFCRDYWMSKYPRNMEEVEGLKASYSYNQASFPRADPGGFYDPYKGRSPQQLRFILCCIDRGLRPYSHETFIIWHTVIRSLGNEERYKDMSNFAAMLVHRVQELVRLGYDFSVERQLAVDATLTFWLVGESQRALGLPINAAVAYSWAVEISKTLDDNTDWDATKAAAFEGQREANEKLQDPRFARVYGGVHDQWTYVLTELQVWNA